MITWLTRLRIRYLQSRALTHRENFRYAYQMGLKSSAMSFLRRALEDEMKIINLEFRLRST